MIKTNDHSADSAVVFHNFLKNLSGHIIHSPGNRQISTARLSIIRFLMESGPQTLKSLASYRKVSAATMSKLVAALVTEGWVLRANSRNDGRSKIFIVTRKGKMMAEDENAKDMKLLADIIQGLTEQEQSRLNKSIELVQKVINLNFG